MMNTGVAKRAFIGMGSNLKNPKAQLEHAIFDIKAIARTTLTECSSWYGSQAIGPGEQPDYVNGVCEIATELDPRALLCALQAIETRHGRERHIRWSARTLDLDLLWYEGVEMESDTLTLPHPRAEHRNFVFFPLRDIAPDLIFSNSKSVKDVADCLPADGVWPLQPEDTSE